MPSPPTLSTPSNLDMAEPRSMDDFGQTYRSTGILVSDRLSLPITVVEPSVVRWRWKLGEGEQMHFTVMFTAAEGASSSWKRSPAWPASADRAADRPRLFEGLGQHSARSGAESSLLR